LGAIAALLAALFALELASAAASLSLSATAKAEVLWASALGAGDAADMNTRWTRYRYPPFRDLPEGKSHLNKGK